MGIPRLTVTDSNGQPDNGDIANAAWVDDFYDTIEEDWAWDTYAPAWTSTGSAPSIGNGTITGHYFKIGKLYHVWITIAFGSTTTFGSGSYRFSVPTAAATNAPLTGIVNATDAGTAGYISHTAIVTTTTFGIVVDGAATSWGPTVPFTWADGDSMTIVLTYEAA